MCFIPLSETIDARNSFGWLIQKAEQVTAAGASIIFLSVITEVALRTFGYSLFHSTAALALTSAVCFLGAGLTAIGCFYQAHLTVQLLRSSHWR